MAIQLIEIRNDNDGKRCLMEDDPGAAVPKGALKQGKIHALIIFKLIAELRKGFVAVGDRKTGGRFADIGNRSKKLLSGSGHGTGGHIGGNMLQLLERHKVLLSCVEVWF